MSIKDKKNKNKAKNQEKKSEGKKLYKAPMLQSLGDVVTLTQGTTPTKGGDAGAKRACFFIE